MGWQGCKHRHEHVADVSQTALSEHRCAVGELADLMRQIFRFAVHEIHEQMPDDTAILRVTLGKGPNLLKVELQRRHCVQLAWYRYSVRNVLRYPTTQIEAADVFHLCA